MKAGLGTGPPLTVRIAVLHGVAGMANGTSLKWNRKIKSTGKVSFKRLTKFGHPYDFASRYSSDDCL